MRSTSSRRPLLSSAIQASPSNPSQRIQLRAVGIDPGFAARARKSGMTNPTADDLVELQNGGLSRPPVPPAPPKVPQRGWNPPDPDPVG